MKKWAKNPWVLGIGTTVIGGVLLSFLNFEIKVWWLLIAIAIIVVGLFVVAKISGS